MDVGAVVDETGFRVGAYQVRFVVDGDAVALVNEELGVVTLLVTGGCLGADVQLRVGVRMVVDLETNGGPSLSISSIVVVRKVEVGARGADGRLVGAKGRRVGA